MQMKNKQPQNVIIVRDLPKNTHRDAVLEKLLVEVNMKIKSFQELFLKSSCRALSTGVFYITIQGDPDPNVYRSKSMLINCNRSLPVTL